MSGTEIQEIRNFDDVVHLLELHPEWVTRLRPIFFTKELLALPEQMSRLTEQVAVLVEVQRHTDQKLAELVEVQRHTDQQLATLTLTVQALTDDMGKVKGKGLETHYIIHGSPFFGVVLRRPQVLSMGEITDLLDTALDQGTLTQVEVREIQRADIIVRGTRREDGAIVYLVVEVSWTVDLGDVERAARRAAYFAQTGLLSLPVVAGEVIRPGAAELAQKLGVWQMTDADVVAPAS